MVIKKSNKKNKIETVADLMKPKKKYFYECYCFNCKGKKVDARTQEMHTKQKNLWKSENSKKNQENTIKARRKKKITSNVNPTKPNLPKKRKMISPSTPPNPPDSPNNEDSINTLFSSKPKSSSHFHDPASDLIEDENNVDDYYYPDYSDDNNNPDDDDYHLDEEDDNFDEEDENEDDINWEKEDFFATPEIDGDNDEVFVMESLNDAIDSEIIIWVFKFQQKFKISDTALEALIKFLRIILTRFNKQQFEEFPTSLYKAKKLLKIFQPKMQLAVCTDCHKLHNATNITTYKEDGKVAIMKCLHQKFPNNPIPSHRKPCNNPLSVFKKNKGEVIAVPQMLYPKPSVRQQLSMLYQRPNFEKMLKSSGIQKENIYSDIYDGEVWKTFSSSDGSLFFTPETATTHLGLLFNLDWFQPFTYTQHSTGAVYASICNLPRSERNKPENIIYLGFLPGPKEVGLERINHYLAPIVDEFLELWRGWNVKTYEYPDGLDIKVALIVGSSDIPATRKLFGHGSAVMKCHRCEKRSTYSHEYRKTHYGGMEEYDEWMTRPADPLLHRQYAQEWIKCSSKNTREHHFKEHGVRWTELLRLPYMDPIRFAVVVLWIQCIAYSSVLRNG